MYDGRKVCIYIYICVFFLVCDPPNEVLFVGLYGILGCKCVYVCVFLGSIGVPNGGIYGFGSIFV